MYKKFAMLIKHKFINYNIFLFDVQSDTIV